MLWFAIAGESGGLCLCCAFINMIFFHRRREWRAVGRVRTTCWGHRAQDCLRRQGLVCAAQVGTHIRKQLLFITLNNKFIIIIFIINNIHLL